MNAKKFYITALFLVLLAFLIPIEHKYDKLFRYFSLHLIPEGLQLPKWYDKKIYFYPSDWIALILTGIAFFWYKVSPKKFFLENRSCFLWAVFACALFSVVFSPFATYPLAYIRLWQLATPFLLFSVVTTVFSPVEHHVERQKVIQWIFWAVVFASIAQSIIAIAQYFKQESLGLRLLGEIPFNQIQLGPLFSMEEGRRWIF